MKTYDNVFIGIVDILGYKNLENKLNSYKRDASEALLHRMYTQLDQSVEYVIRNSDINWMRYGDGYVFHSPDSNVNYLSNMVKISCRLIAQALNASFPLRIAITQNSINVDNPAAGLTISGPGWLELMEIEKALDWMGGFLYLPRSDGTHQKTLEELVQTAYLVKEQTHSEMRFTPPIKQNHHFQKDKTWFLNWYKILRQTKDDVDRSIKGWWSQVPVSGDINKCEEAERKQRNSIQFADYCRTLIQAAELVFYSDINRELPIVKIRGDSL